MPGGRSTSPVRTTTSAAAAAAALIGLAYWGSGDLEAAHAVVRRRHGDACERAGHIADVLGCAITLADIRIAQGRLGDAMRTYERGAAARPPSTRAGRCGERRTCTSGWPRCHRERDDLTAARRAPAAQPGARRARRPAAEPVPLAGRDGPGAARPRATSTGALELLDEAERVYAGDFSPDVRPIPAMRARVWVAQGRLGRRAAAGCASGACRPTTSSATCASSSTSPWPGCCWRSTGASALTASVQQAVALLERLLLAAEDGGRGGSVIEILVLQALAHQARGDTAAALAPLERALALAEPEGYVRIFVDEGAPMAALLERPRRAGPPRRYVRRLLAAFGGTRPVAPAAAGWSSR